MKHASFTYYSAIRGYDAVGNVISENTSLGAATTTDNQLFCYDEQNRLVWAGATGTSLCNGAVSSGTLTTAYYSQAYGYDAQGRLLSGAIGSYTYGDSSHPHAVTAIGGGAYTASYDAVGDLTCRAPNSSVTCAGTPTGATLAYDAERRLAHWQNTPSSPTTQEDVLYDGEGNRVEQYVQSGGLNATTTYLLGGLEEISNGVVTTYLGAKGAPTAVRVYTGGSLSYLANDGLGSVSVALDDSGHVVASQLYGPYGASRYSNGTMPTSKGFTGQRADVTSGLDYYNARYYDPQAGQFVSADSMSQGLSRYGYVGGNPETATDPSGHRMCQNNKCGGSGGDTTAPIRQYGPNETVSDASTGSTAAACAGFDHCVVLIEGPNISLPKELDALGIQISDWSNWIQELLTKYKGDVGFVLFEAADASSGANQLHQVLSGLTTEGFSGSVSVAGFSNGAAALFTYMSSHSHGTGSDAIINSFVALDAPTGGDLSVALHLDFWPLVATGAWSEWNPALTEAGDYQYMAANGTQGIYGYNLMDPASSAIAGPWAGYVTSQSSAFDATNAHTWLRNNPQPQLLKYL